MPREASLSTEQVVAKALEMARREGIDAVGYNGLARELGIRPQSMYRYVANIRELRVRMLAACLGDLAQQLEDAVDGLDPRDALRAYAVCLYDSCHENPLYYQSFTLMHQYGVVNELETQLRAVTDVPWRQFVRLHGEGELASRHHQLFMAVNLGYAQMSMNALFSDPLHDNRGQFIASIDELLCNVL